MNPTLFLDVTRLVGRRWKGKLPTGIDRVCLEYVRHYGAHAGAVVRWRSRTLALTGECAARLFALLTDPPLPHLLRLRLLTLFSGAWRHLGNASHLRGAVLINAGHSGLERPRYAEELRQLGVRPVFVVHDLIPITHAEYGRQGEKIKHVIRMSNVLKAARGIVTNSADTLREMERFAVIRKTAMPPATSALLAPASLPQPADASLLDKPYFVVLSTIEPRKNHLMLLNIWREMARSFGKFAPRLVLIGQRGWESENLIDMLERCEGLRDLVIEKPRCSDAELATWLRHAKALLMPSFVEGYGMPVVEALAMGTPVVASALPVFREIAGEIPDYLDPLDGLGWKRTIINYATLDSVDRQSQIQRMGDFIAPTWTAHFHKVDALLAQLQDAPESVYPPARIEPS